MTRACVVLLGIVMLTAGCAPQETPEARVRAVVAAAETAAEARDLSALMGLVSPAYRDEEGRRAEELKQYLRGYLLTHQSVHLLTRVESVEFPYRDIARVRLTVGTLGRETGAAATSGFAADAYDVVLQLQLVDDEWKVLRAGWESAARG